MNNIFVIVDKKNYFGMMVMVLYILKG